MFDDFCLSRCYSKFLMRSERSSEFCVHEASDLVGVRAISIETILGGFGILSFNIGEGF